MALRDLLCRLESRAVTAAPAAHVIAVTQDPASSVTCTVVTAVTAQNNNANTQITDLPVQMAEHRGQVIDLRAYLLKLCQRLPMPPEHLLQHYFTDDDIADIESGCYTDPGALHDRIKSDPLYPFGWISRAHTYALKQTQIIAVDPLAPLIAQGLELVPDDRRYLLDSLAAMTPEQGCKTLAGYATTWLAAIIDQPSHQRQNAGRLAANTWLRLGVNQ